MPPRRDVTTPARSAESGATGGLPASVRAFDPPRHGRASRQWHPINAAGFTLIEIMAALVLMGVLSAAVVVNLSGPTRAARMEDAIGQVRQYDRMTRAAARRSGAADVLTFDLSRGEIHRAANSAATWVSIAQPIRIDRLLLPGRRVETGRADVPISADGRSPSYAVRLIGPQDEARWLFIAGLTGATIQPENDRDAQALFDALAPDPTP